MCFYFTVANIQKKFHTLIYFTKKIVVFNKKNILVKKNRKIFGQFTESLYLCTRKTKNDAPVAQLVEHLTLNQGVQGSSPCGCTKTKDDRLLKFVIFCFLQGQEMSFYLKKT